jgi:hypothetical protein
MKSKPFLIAIAAFAVTATGVQAYQGTQILERAGLNDEQIEAFEAARELKEAGKYKAARDTLLEAGVNEDVIKSVHKALHEQRDAIHDAVMAEDYEAFKEAVAGTPLQEAVDSEDDFKRFITAHDLREAGKWNEAKVILDDLGIEPPQRMSGMGRGKGMMGRPDFLNDLTDEQRDALEVAKKANDKEAVKAILKEAGVERPQHKGMHW